MKDKIIVATYIGKIMSYYMRGKAYFENFLLACLFFSKAACLGFKLRGDISFLVFIKLLSYIRLI